MPDEPELQPLKDYLARVPGIEEPISGEFSEDGSWWVKFSIDLDHPLAWNVVQEMGCVLNYLSVSERLPTVFKPVSPAPYLNGGPRSFLSWVIECKDNQFPPAKCAEWLNGRLPRPVDDLSQWPEDDAEETNEADLSVEVHDQQDPYATQQPQADTPETESESIKPFLITLLLILTVGAAGGFAIGWFAKGRSTHGQLQAPEKTEQPNTHAASNPSLSSPKGDSTFQNSLGMQFVRIDGLLMSIYETRVQDFETFVTETHYQPTQDVEGFGRFGRWKKNGETWSQPGFSQTSEHPVVAVSGKDATAFCNWLTQKERKEGLLTGNQHYRLPTREEWSRVAGTTKFPWGNQWPPPPEAGNFIGSEATEANPPRRWPAIPGYKDSSINTAPVGTFSPNANGFYDLAGNAWETCLDPDGTFFIMGGSCYVGDQTKLTSRHSEKASPTSSANDRGFRCVLEGK